MKTVAIITEYNPFHNGHEYQIKEVRRMLGDDVAVIAIMSGNFTQRGELAIADKTVRARAAVECGVNLVLELPFPYSMSSAEFFARSGVHIAEKLGIVDYLAFGSELGDTEALVTIAENMSSHEYSECLNSLTQDKKYSTYGYPALCEIAYTKLFSGCLTKDFFTPNNILAIEYIKALRKEKSSIVPITVKREGAGYSDEKIVDSPLQSATAIRTLINCNDTSALDFVPENAKYVYSEAIKAGTMPTEPERPDSAVISYFRLSSPTDNVEIHDTAGGLYDRLCDFGVKATSISSLTSMTETKKYTRARIRRAIWYSYLGVTSSDVTAYPEYTQLLACDSVGRSLLKRIKKVSDFALITKPSDYDKYSESVIRQKKLSNKADSIFALAHKIPISGSFALSFTPYVKK